MSDDKRYGIGELAKLGGVSRRTVRYYVQRGLLPAPTGTGRGDHYTQQHLDALIQVKQLQEAGVPLAEIAQRLSGTEDPTPPMVSPSDPAALPIAHSPAPSAPKRSQWIRLHLAEGLELHLRLDRFGLNDGRMTQLIAAVRRILGQE